MKYKPAPDKAYNKVVRSADLMCLLQPPGYLKSDTEEPLPYWMDVQAYLSLCWSHVSYCRLYRALAHISDPVDFPTSDSRRFQCWTSACTLYSKVH